MMRTRPQRLALTGVLFWLGLPAAADAQLGALDLAADGRVVQIDPGRLSVVTIINRIPGREYRHTVLIETQPVAPIELPTPISGIQRVQHPCKGSESVFDDWIAALANAPDEQAVDALVKRADEIRRALEKAGKPCLDEQEPEIRQALNSTIGVIDLRQYVVERGEQLTLTIVRADPAPARTWTYVLRAPRAGQWLTTWGFTFAQDRDDRFFLDPGEEETFTVRRERSQDEWDLEFVPSVFFHWMPGGDEKRDWSWSPFTAGVGVNKEAPAVMIGTSITRRQNVSLIFGGVLSRALRLDGVYEEGDVLTENLPTDKLHEGTYRAGVFLSLAIRFDRNPFSSGDDPAEPPAEGEKEPTEGEKKEADGRGKK